MGNASISLSSFCPCCEQPIIATNNTGPDPSSSAAKSSSTFTFQYHTNTCALEYYEPVRSLTEGSISSIHLVRRRKQRVDIPYQERADIMLWSNSTNSSSDNGNGDTEQLYVLKSIMKDHVHNDACLAEMRSEIYTMKHLDHPGIAKVYEGFERKRHIYLVMEYCSGGDLHTRFPYTEQQAASIVRQILSAVTYLHSNHVVHRDIKLENVVFENKTPNAHVKLIDFGLATRYLSDEYRFMRERVGTLYSMAPQVIQGVYSAKCDLWSVGVITYMLLSGGDIMPFPGRTRKQMINKIMRCDYNFDHPVWKQVSQDAKEFISSLLKMDPQERPSARRALKSKWIRKQQQRSDGGGGGGRDTATAVQTSCNSLQRYSQEAKLKQIALLLLAHNTTSDELAELRSLFEQYDLTGDGMISYKEFRQALQQAETKLKLEDIHHLFQDIDIGKDGVINYTEFLAATLETRGRIETQKLKEVFDRLDCDHSGKITKEDMKESILTKGGGGMNISESFIDELFEELNTETYGTVTYDEFLKLFETKKKEEALEALCCPTSVCDKEQGNDDSNNKESILVGEDAIIPGGKYSLDDIDQNNKPAAPSTYVYDSKTKSMHRYDSFLKAARKRRSHHHFSTRSSHL